MTDPREGVTEGLDLPDIPAHTHGNGMGQVPQGSPTHIAIPIQAWKATLEILNTLPYGQVSDLIPMIQHGHPMAMDPVGQDAG